MQVHTPTKADDQIVAAVRRWLHLGMSRELRIAVAMLTELLHALGSVQCCGAHWGCCLARKDEAYVWHNVT